MGALLGPVEPDSTHGLGAFQRLDLGLLVHTANRQPLGGSRGGPVLPQAGVILAADPV
jgi:hypothetical protein